MREDDRVLKISKENEAEEIVRIFMLTPINIHPFKSFNRIIEVMHKYSCEFLVLGAIYNLGRMHGIQAERKRRSGGKCL